MKCLLYRATYLCGCSGHIISCQLNGAFVNLISITHIECAREAHGTSINALAQKRVFLPSLSLTNVRSRLAVSMSKQIELPPVLTIMSVLVIGKLLGPLGLVIALPPSPP